MSTILLDTFTSANAASIQGRAPESSTGSGTWNDGYLVGIVSNKAAWTGTGNPSAGGYAGIGIGANPYGYDAASPSTATATVDFTLTSTADFTYGRRGVSCGFGSTDSIGTNKYISVKFSSPIESSQWYMTISVSDLPDSTHAVSLSGGTPYSVQIEFSPSGAAVLFQGTLYTVSSSFSGFRVGNLSLDDVGNGCSIESVLVTDVNIDVPDALIDAGVTFPKPTFAASGTVSGAPLQMNITLPVLQFSTPLTLISAPLNLPRATAAAYGAASAGIVLPTIRTVSTLTDVKVKRASATITLPRLDVAASGCGVSRLTLPKLLAAASATGLERGIINVTLPSLTAAADVRVSAMASADITLSPPVVSSALGGVSKLRIPALAVSSTVTVATLASADCALPALTAAAAGRVSAMASADITLPAFSATAYSGAVCSVTIDNKIVMASNVITGGVASAQITLPLFEASATATANAYGSAAIVLPSLALGTTSQTAVSMPPLRLIAIGSATITGTYEAYAVNLKHTHRPNVETIDEVTHYTNYPFTHVVRYQNNYYGANSTGLFLLEGTTDDAVPIPWAVKTAMTDFKSPTKKTLVSAYFGGRFGPASTIKLHAGEKTPNSYSFSTPRGALAQNHRQVFGKGLKERYYALEASGTGVCELDNIELEVHNISRRI